MKKIKIFISSVQKEFAKEREALAEYLYSDPLPRRFFGVYGSQTPIDTTGVGLATLVVFTLCTLAQTQTEKEISIQINCNLQLAICNQQSVATRKPANMQTR